MTNYIQGPTLGSHLLLPEQAPDHYYIRDTKFITEDEILCVGQTYFYPGEMHEKTLDLRSSNKKLVVPTGNSFLYMIHNLLGEIILHHKNNKDIEIIYCVDDFDAQIRGPENYYKDIHKFIFNIFKNEGIKYKVFDQTKNPSFLVNNFYKLRNLPNTDFTASVYDYINRYVDAPYLLELLPWRKVFLTRRHMWSRPIEQGEIFFANPPRVGHDDRIDDHERLENLFIELGFEIVNPELFTSFEDQVRYFDTVKCLASLTSSGLTNSMFMQQGQTVVELTTPLIHLTGDHYEEQAHYYYNLIALAKHHKFISIQNMYRSADLLEKAILSDENLYNYLKNI